MASFTNAVNLRLAEGGEQVKQGDTASLFVYELLDERMKAIELDGKEVVLRLVGRKGGVWSRTLRVEANKVSFTIDEVLPLDTYTVEIVAGGYVFPSDHKTKIKVVKSEVDYATGEVVGLQRLSIAEEVKKQLASLDVQGVDEDRIIALIKDNLPAGYDDSALQAQISQILGQITALEDRVDKDTIYDDRELRELVRGLESRVENLPKVDTSNLATKAELADYAKKSDLPKPYNDGPVQEFIAKEPQRRLEIEAGMRQEMQALLANQPDGSKFGKNLLKDSGVWYSNKSYPTTSYFFVEEPVAGKTYTLTFKSSLGASKNVWSVQLRNGEGTVGAVARSASGIYQIEVVWPKKRGTAPLEMQFYAAPNNGAVSTIEWVKLVEGKDTDLAWYPNYDEVVDKYSMGRSVAQALTVSSNLLDGTAGEKAGANEFLSYMDIASVLDAHGTGVYTLSFDVKAAKAGKLTVYFSGTRKYQFLLDQVDVTTDWQRLVLPIDISLENAGNKTAMLSFFGTYGTGVIPTVRRVRLSKGDYESLEWRPSDKELAEIYAKLM